MCELKDINMRDREKQQLEKLLSNDKIISVEYVQQKIYIVLMNSKVIVIKNSDLKTYFKFEKIKNTMYEENTKKLKYTTKKQKNSTEWDEESENFLRLNYDRYELDQLSVYLKKSVYQISVKAIELKLLRKREWKTEELDFLRENMEISNYELSMSLKRSIHSIKAKKRVLQKEKKRYKI